MSASRALAAAVLIGAAAPALACGSQVVATTVCPEWAPISGDPAADACTVAKLDLVRLADEYDAARPRTVADDPLPPAAIRFRRLHLAIARVARACAQ
ncbi:hypothetical protein CWB41_14090 [Methylovirgula ligni]|uniref:UrcA family protein n=1 Tax=Methylovirgula ligni TaxID=569860 RepID=A0A3D9YL08_9HYPH|nr:hypothetical protein [Methylovirgula ligni]QAY96723.1 hypothetical protein CWB41_14090 [Methylovirgula ligni]REF83235.1 hypothetical protein DES32_3151 [Methylovirgula ligni]